MGEITLEVGKRYKTREGRLVDIVSQASNTIYPMTGTYVDPPFGIGIMTWTTDGIFDQTNPSGLDIMEEIGLTDPTSIESEPIKFGSSLTVKENVAVVVLTIEDRDDPLQIMISFKGKIVPLTTIINPSDKG